MRLKLLLLLFLTCSGLFGQIPPPFISLPVKTEFGVIGPNGGHFTYTFMAGNWEKSELYITNSSSITVIDTKTWMAKNTIPVPMSPTNLCISPNGILASTTSLPPSVILTNPTDGSSRVLNTGLLTSSSCSFSADGKKFYVSSNLSGSPSIDKLSVIDTTTWLVIKTWTTDDNCIPTIQALPNGKLYALTQNPYNTAGNLKLLDTAGNIRTVEIGFMPTAISLAPNGFVYISGRTITADGKLVSKGVAIDSDSDTLLAGNLTTFNNVYAFPSSDPWFAYIPFGNGLDARNLATGNMVFGGIIRDTDTRVYGLTAKRQPDGSDLVAVLRDSRVDVYKAVQPPTLYAVTNGASFSTDPVVSPGEWISIFGHALSSQTAMAGKIPLPTELGSAKVWMQIDNTSIALPLVFVSPDQVNAQFPTEVPVGVSVKFWVQEPGNQIGYLRSYSAAITVAATTPALFLRLEKLPDVQPILQRPNGSFADSVLPGEYITLYATGLGQVSPPVASGVATPSSPLTWTANKPEVLLAGRSCEVLFSGLSPGWVGLGQINLRIPPDVPAGRQVLVIKQAGASSPEYSITVSGGLTQ